MSNPDGTHEHEDFHSVRPVRAYKAQGYGYWNNEGVALPMVNVGVEALAPGVDARHHNDPTYETSLFEFMISTETARKLIEDLQFAVVEAENLAERGNSP